MPFVHIHFVKGHPQDRKDENERGVTASISDIAELPPEAIWVVFEDVTGDDWFVGATRVSELKKQAGKTGASSTRTTRASKSAIRSSGRWSATLSPSRGSPPAS